MCPTQKRKHTIGRTATRPRGPGVWRAGSRVRCASRPGRGGAARCGCGATRGVDVVSCRVACACGVASGVAACGVSRLSYRAALGLALLSLAGALQRPAEREQRRVIPDRGYTIRLSQIRRREIRSRAVRCGQGETERVRGVPSRTLDSRVESAVSTSIALRVLMERPWIRVGVWFFLGQATGVERPAFRMIVPASDVGRPFCNASESSPPPWRRLTARSWSIVRPSSPLRRSASASLRR